MDPRVVMHVDFDYFYAQCEELRRPELRPRPVCVCMFSDRGGGSGAVAAANYVARRHGARAGMPVSLARRKLDGKGAEFVRADHDYYGEVSGRAMAAVSPLADAFEYVGVDEAYLDVTGRTGGDFGRAAHLAQQLKNSVREASGIRCSVGVSPCRLVSKVASAYKKPDGLTVVRPEMLGEFLGPLEVRRIPGVGGKTAGELARMGLGTVEQLRGADIFELNRAFGRRTGTYLHNAARGIDGTPVREREPRAQYSRISTLRADTSEQRDMEGPLRSMCADVHAAASADSAMFRTVGVQLVLSDMSARSRSRTLRAPTSSLAELERCAASLLLEALAPPATVRRLGVRVSELTRAAGQRDISSYF